MDIEAKKIYCGLLMFDVPISSNAPINNDDASVPSMPQNCVSRSPDFPTTTGIVLSAGAATGNDYTAAQGNNEDGSRIQQPKRTPRPPNAFILYRKAKQPAIIAAHKHLTNAEISKKISDMWKSEPEENILKWERLADQRKLEHMQTYPNYVYCPNKNKSKVDKRKQRRRSSNKDPLTSPVRKKSTKNSTGTTPEKFTDSSSPETVSNGIDGFNTFNTQSSSISMSPQQRNVNDYVPTMISSPLFTESPKEYVNSQEQLAPNTPITPSAPSTPILPHQMQLRESDNQFWRYGPEDLQQHAYQQSQHQQHQQQQHQHQGNNHDFSFTPLALYNSANEFSHQVNPLYCLLHRQIMADAMPHHDQNPHISSNDSPVSNTYQYLHQNGGNSINANPNNSVVSYPYEMLAGIECPNYMGGSVNHPQYFQ